MAINTQKLVPSSFGSQQVSQKKLIEVKRSVIDVEKLMTGIVAFEKKQQDAQRKSTEEKRYQKRENDLERKTIKKQFKMNLPSLPRMGFFDWIKNFVTNTLLGFFAVRLLKYVPKLIGVAGLALNAAEGILNFAGGLLNGAATFIEWGYKAYDATRGFLKQIGGENFTQLFDKFLNGLDTFLLLTLGASTFKIGREIIGNVLKLLATTVGGGALGRFGGKLLSAFRRVPVRFQCRWLYHHLLYQLLLVLEVLRKQWSTLRFQLQLIGSGHHAWLILMNDPRRGDLLNELLKAESLS